MPTTIWSAKTLQFLTNENICTEKYILYYILGCRKVIAILFIGTNKFRH